MGKSGMETLRILVCGLKMKRQANPQEISHILNSMPFFAQALPRGAAASASHIIFAYKQSTDAFRKGTNLLKGRNLEFLLRLSGEKQLGKALEMAEIKGKTRETVLVAAGKGRKLAAANLRKSLRELEKCGFVFKPRREMPEPKAGAENPAIERTAMVALEE